MSIQSEIQDNINACFEHNKVVFDEDIAAILDEYLDSIEADVEVLEFVNPKVNGKFIVEFTSDFANYKYSQSEYENNFDFGDEEEEEIDYPEDDFGAYDAEFYRIYRIYDSQEDEENDL